MGKFLAALFSLVLGIALGAVGIPLAVWVAIAGYRAEVALDWAVWLVERSPLPFYAPAVQVANDAIRRDSLIASALVAALLCLMAFSLVRSARQALRSPDESHDGKGTIELKTRPLRVGRPVEGNIWLTQDPAPGQLYRVELSCKRDHGSGRSEGSETPYSEELEVAPVRSPVGWSLPFRFVVSPIAPPSGNRYVSGPGYRWRLAFRRSKGWIPFPSVFALNLAPAPPEELRALEKKEAAAQKQAINEIVRNVGKEPALYELAQLREPSVGARKADAMAPRTRTVMSEGASRGGRGTLWDLTPGDARATDAMGPGTRAVMSEGAPRGGTEAPNLFADATPGGARAGDTLAYDFSTDVEERASRGGTGAPNSFGDVTPGGLPGKIAKWLFLVVVGGTLAVSAVALATAVLLRHIM